MSPDLNAVLSWEIKFVIDLHVERTVPGINISDGAVHSISLRRVRVGRKLLSHCLIGLSCAKALRITEKKSLISGQAVQHRCRTPGQRTTIGIERDENSAEIGDVFVYGQMTVHVHSPKGLEGIVLSSKLGSANVELTSVGVIPPIRERAFRVVFASIIIKGVVNS